MEHGINALTLLVSAGLVFVLGSRFFAKFLTFGIFHLTHDAPPPAVHRNDGHDFVPARRWILFGHYTAAVTGVVTLVGAAIGAIWGWVPAFIWIVAGTVVAGGTFALGSLWASLRKSGESLPSVAYELVGLRGALCLFFLGLVLLVVLSAVLCMLLGQLLYTHPEATWAFLAFIPITVVVRRSLMSSGVLRAASWSLAAVVLFASALIAGQYFPLGLSGSWSIRLAGTDVLGLPHDLVWAALALATAYIAARAPLPWASRPRGVFVAGLLGLVLVVVVAGVVIAMPEVVAPRLHTGVDLPPFPALLGLVVTGGALAGFHGLIATGPVVRQLEKQRDAPLCAYGSVIADGTVALLALLAVTAGVAGTQDWDAVYGQWPTATSLNVWLDLVITRLAGFIAALGIPVAWSVGLVAALCAGLALTNLENVLRALGFAIGEFVEDFEIRTYDIPHFRERAASAITALAVLWFLQHPLGLDVWLTLGIASQFFVCVVLALLALGMARLGRNVAFFLAPGIIVLPLASWGAGWCIVDWWQRGAWSWLVLAFVVILLGILGLEVTVRALWSMQRERQAAARAQPPAW